MASKIEITFSVDAVDSDVVQFSKERYTNPIPPVVLKESWLEEPRSGSYKMEAVVTSIPPDSIIGEATARAYEQYFALDYNGGGTLNISRYQNKVTIEFSAAGCDNYFTNFSSTNLGITAVITNCPQVTFNITDVSFGEAASPCANVQMSITTDEVAPVILLNGNQIESSNASNPYIFDVARAFFQKVTLQNAGGDTISTQTYKFGMLSPGAINIVVQQSMVGATITVNADLDGDNNPQSVLQYSLDNVAFQASNVFTGQAVGSGTMYIKDEWGCTVSKAYEVTELGTRSSYLFISRANSINFSENEDWDGYNIFKNDNNVLAHQDLTNINFCEKLLFQTNDITPIQFHSNYETVTVSVRDEAGNSTPQTVIKRSENLGRFKRMDAWYYQYKSGKLGIYFEAGQTYDNGGSPIGTYTLGGNLPEFAIVGQYVTIDGVGTFQITDVTFDPVVKKKIIVVDYIYSGIPVACVVESIYDLLPFEVYEAFVNWADFGEGFFDVLITNDDTTNGTVQHLSENIFVQNEHKDTLAIRYYNNNNRDIFYKWGIQHFIRIPFIHIEGGALDENEINIADLSTSVIETSVHETDTISFDTVTKAVMRKLIIALACENLYINGMGYVKSGGAEIENIQNSNGYDVKVELIKTNENFNNNRQGQDGAASGDIDFDIPAFIWDEEGFIKS